MVRDGWNFHGDIALGLESSARSFFGGWDRPFGKIYDADAIEQATFVEVMIIMLRMKTGYSYECEEINEFVEKCGMFVGKSGHDIPKETAQALYDEFENLFSKNA